MITLAQALAFITPAQQRMAGEILESNESVIPPCNGTRAGAAARAAWWRTAKALYRHGVRVVRRGGDVWAAIPVEPANQAGCVGQRTHPGRP